MPTWMPEWFQSALLREQRAPGAFLPAFTLYQKTRLPLLPALVWSLQETTKDLSGPLFNKFSNRVSTVPLGISFLFLCCELTVWILELVCFN